LLFRLSGQVTVITSWVQMQRCTSRNKVKSNPQVN
jgi:hypothetical protein